MFHHNHAGRVKRPPRKMSTADRVLLVHRIMRWQILFIPCTKDVCEWAGVAELYYRTFRRLNPGQRAAVELGVARLSTFHNARPTNGNGHTNGEAEPAPQPCDGEVEILVIGPAGCRF